jgi:NADH dehydrogenase
MLLVCVQSCSCPANCAGPKPCGCRRNQSGRVRMSYSMTSQTEQGSHVVVVGGGFGGWYAAKRLARVLPAGGRVTLVDRVPYMLYTPMLTEAAGRSVSLAHVTASSRTLPTRVKFVQAEVTGIDTRTRTVTLADGATLVADHLLIALGSTTNYRGIDGAQAHSVTMKTLEDARRVMTVAQRNVERASKTADRAERKRLLTVVVAGGGYTGVETIASVNDLVRDTAKRHGIAASELAITLVEPGKGLMTEMPETLGEYGKKKLEEDGIRVLLGVGVQSVKGDGLTLTNGETLHTGLLVWDTGIVPSPLIAGLDCTRGKKGGIATDSTFRAEGLTNVWAIGDCAEIPKPYAEGKFFEPTAQNATREGALVADNIAAWMQGKPVKPFEYKQIGELAVLARYAGVAHVFGMEFKGFFGFLMWRGVYLMKMPGLAQKAGILLDWIKLLFGRKNVSMAGAGTAERRV